MEFPKLGVRCTLDDCKQNDFLPFECDRCRRTFCKDHFLASSHHCPVITENYVAPVETVSKNFKCSSDSCKESSPVEIPCVQCKLHFCVAHRYHGCLEMDANEKQKKVKKWLKPKADFAIAKAAADVEVKEALKKSKNVAMANKVTLMRLKGAAVGGKNIPTTDRRYFLVHPPKTNCPKTEPIPIFVSVQWTIGKAADAFAKAFRVFNTNIGTAEKLRLFHHGTGLVVAESGDAKLTELLDDNSLIDGQTLILEFSNAEGIDPSPYK